MYIILTASRLWRPAASALPLSFPSDWMSLFFVWVWKCHKLRRAFSAVRCLLSVTTWSTLDFCCSGGITRLKLKLCVTGHTATVNILTKQRWIRILNFICLALVTLSINEGYFSPANGWIYKKMDGRTGIGLIWLRIGTGGGPLWTRWWTSRSCKMKEIYQQARNN
jgi:hypothetical protein